MLTIIDFETLNQILPPPSEEFEIAKRSKEFEISFNRFAICATVFSLAFLVTRIYLS